MNVVQMPVDMVDGGNEHWCIHILWCDG